MDLMLRGTGCVAGAMLLIGTVCIAWTCCQLGLFVLQGPVVNCRDCLYYRDLLFIGTVCVAGTFRTTSCGQLELRASLVCPTSGSFSWTTMPYTALTARYVPTPLSILFKGQPHKILNHGRWRNKAQPTHSDGHSIRFLFLFEGQPDVSKMVVYHVGTN